MVLRKEGKIVKTMHAECAFDEPWDADAYAVHIEPVPCDNFVLDTAVCDDVGEPKGQCAICGFNYGEHNSQGSRNMPNSKDQ